MDKALQGPTNSECHERSGVTRWRGSNSETCAPAAAAKISLPPTLSVVTVVTGARNGEVGLPAGAAVGVRRSTIVTPDFLPAHRMMKGSAAYSAASAKGTLTGAFPFQVSAPTSTARRLTSSPEQAAERTAISGNLKFHAAWIVLRGCPLALSSRPSFNNPTKLTALAISVPAPAPPPHLLVPFFLLHFLLTLCPLPPSGDANFCYGLLSIKTSHVHGSC